MDMKKVGSQIIKYRKQKGYTQESLAEILQITHQAISKWENGIALPDTSLLIDFPMLLIWMFLLTICYYNIIKIQEN